MGNRLRVVVDQMLGLLLHLPRVNVAGPQLDTACNP
jgi:hypothetical protein